MKYFIITVDTEGDNPWTYTKCAEIATVNTRFIPRFQELCEKYALKPTYLTNYEMTCDREFQKFARHITNNNTAEIGVHLHAWNNPPIYNLSSKYPGNPYLIEYPDDIMREKFRIIYDRLTDMTGVPPTSHRAGRWGMDQRYFKILKDFGIIADCSYTPHIYWHNSCGETIESGPDYRNVNRNAHYIDGILEVPMTVRVFKDIQFTSLKDFAKSLLRGRIVWLRPATCPLSDMLKLIDIVDKEPETDYLEFMIHSSELMPGGSPYFKTPDDINNLYDVMDAIFKKVSESGHKGVSLSEYARTK